jgi:hypothetical protein
MEMSHHHAYFILDDIKTYFKYLRIYLVLLRPGKYNTLLQIAEETEKIILNFIFFWFFGISVPARQGGTHL